MNEWNVKEGIERNEAAPVTLQPPKGATLNIHGFTSLNWLLFNSHWLMNSVLGRFCFVLFCFVLFFFVISWLFKWMGLVIRNWFSHSLEWMEVNAGCGHRRWIGIHRIQFNCHWICLTWKSGMEFQVSRTETREKEREMQLHSIPRRDLIYWTNHSPHYSLIYCLFTST